MAFIGVDLHTNSFTICRLEADYSESFETFQLSQVDLDRFCRSVDADDELAIEATGNSAWFYGELCPCVGRIVVVNPRQFQVIRKSVKKTDRNDARALAFFLSKDMLPETRLKSTEESELASTTQTRDLLVKQRTMLLNKIHGMFNRHGIKLKKEGLSSEQLPAGAGSVMQVIIQVLKYSVLCDCAVGGRKVAPAPKLAPPVSFFEFGEFALQLIRRTALHLADQIGNGNLRRH